MKIFNFWRNVKSLKITGFLFAVVLLIQGLLLSCATPPVTNQVSIETNDIRDYVCIVNRSLHPNIERFITAFQDVLISDGDKDFDDIAMYFESIKRGGFGSGFVYVDNKGFNYIITNYHVIAGAYRLSVTFETENLEKRTYLNLSVLYADEQADLAILAFPDGQRPFTQGIPLSATPLRSGMDVSAAGYPGLYNQPVWAFSRGSIVNPHITPPGEEDWSIQHSSEIHPGNSGGPLLVADQNSPLGYSVAGINTYYISRDAGSSYFAIPTEKLNSFLQTSFLQENTKEALEGRIEAFMDLLRISSNTLIFEELFPFLSNSMIALDPTEAMDKLPDEMDVIYSQFITEDLYVGLGWAVAYNEIENYTYMKDRNVQPELLSIAENNFGGYTVNFLISGYPYKTEWVKEYGVWKIDDFSEATGEYNDISNYATTLLLEKKTKFSLASDLDHDWYVLEIPSTGILTVWTEGNTDTCISIYYDASTQDSMKRTLIGEDDDGGSGLNARISSNVRAGKVYIWIYGFDSGEYTLCTKFE